MRTLRLDLSHSLLTAPLRHRRATAAAIGLCLAAAVAGHWAMPASYRTEARLLVRDPVLVEALGDPVRPILVENDAPASWIGQEILATERLELLARAIRLPETEERTRAPIERVVAALAGALLRPDADDVHRARIERLARHLQVVESDGNISIATEWSDPMVAHQVAVEAVQQIVELRHRAEVSPAAEAVGILEAHVASAHATLERAAAALTTAARGRLPPARHAEEALDAEAERLDAALSARARALSELEAFRARRRTAVQAALMERRLAYGANHPALLAAEREVALLTAPSLQVEALREAVETASAEYRTKTGRAPRAAGEPRGVNSVVRAAAASSADALATERAVLRQALDGYDRLNRRLRSTRIQLDAARAAFGSRYFVVTPPDVPSRPERPRAARTLLGGLLSGLALAWVLAAALDAAATARDDGAMGGKDGRSALALPEG